MSPVVRDTPLPGLGSRLLGALRSGALIGLPVGLVLAVVVLVADDTDVTFAAYAIPLGLAAFGLGIGLILWFSAWAWTHIAQRYVKVHAPLAREGMTLERVLVGLGAAAAAACAPVAVVALAQGEKLF